MGSIEGRIQTNVSLANLTTIGLGGVAAKFVVCESKEDIADALQYARQRNLTVHILGGGSNTIFSDEGFKGLVIQIAISGTDFKENREKVTAVIGAGEDWDTFVKTCVNKNYAGVECLSGIPGTVGATPIQNVGAYGQDVSNIIMLVRVLNRITLNEETFSAAKCGFGYRTSRFKKEDANKFIVLEVNYHLTKGGDPTMGYPELVEQVERQGAGRTLQAVRDAVLSIRAKKSMIVSRTDPHSRSCGSFFVNPVMTQKQYRQVVDRALADGEHDVPSFPAGGAHMKVPAAWLIEHAGFSKGYRQGGVGISPHHTLALVNYGGTSKEILELASDIELAVQQKFSVDLVREPVVVQESFK